MFGQSAPAPGEECRESLVVRWLEVDRLEAGLEAYCLTGHTLSAHRLHLALNPDAARREAGMAKSTHHRAIARIRAFLERRGIEPAGD